MNIPKREISAGEAARLVSPNIQRTLNDHRSTSKQVGDAIIPVYGIRWVAQIARRATRGLLCKIPASLRNPRLDAKNYQRTSPYGKPRN